MTETDTLRQERAAVIEEARAFFRALDLEPADRAVSAADLSQAAQTWAGGPGPMQGFRPGQDGESAASTLDRLDAVAADLEIAQVLFAAGAAADEVDADVDSRALLQASLTNYDDRAPEPQENPSSVAGFGSRQAAPSTDPMSGDVVLQRVQACIDGIVAATLEILQDVWHRLRDVVPEAVEKALGAMGDALDAVPSIGNFLKLALRGIQRALRSLLDLLPRPLRDKVEQVASTWWSEHRDDVSGAVVSHVLRADEVRRIVAAIDAAAISEAASRDATDSLDSLTRRFARFTTILKRILTGLAGAVGMAAVVAIALPGIAAWVPVAGAVGFLLLSGSAILAARDYLDTGDVMARVQGVQSIASRLRSP